MRLEVLRQWKNLKTSTNYATAATKEYTEIVGTAAVPADNIVDLNTSLQ
jgi:hypothetical protein